MRYGNVITSGQENFRSGSCQWPEQSWRTNQQRLLWRPRPFSWRGGPATSCTSVFLCSSLLNCDQNYFLVSQNWQKNKIKHLRTISHHELTKLVNSGLKFWSEGSVGGSPSTTLARTSKSDLQYLYGNTPVASSIRVIPRLQTSARMS